MNKTILKILTTGTAGLLLLTAAGCSTSSTPSSSVDMVSSSESSSMSSSDLASSDGADVSQAAAPEGAASTASTSASPLYRGTIEDMAVGDNGATVWIVRQDNGADYGAPEVGFVIDNGTKFNFDSQNVANGTRLEFHFDGELTQSGDTRPQLNASEVNELPPVDIATYNGVITSITPDPANAGAGDLLMKPLGENGMEILFHYNTETVLAGVSIDSLKAGDKLHIVFNGATTRSIPAQATAQEMRPYVEAAPGSQPIPLQ